jgi:hypothetical protein
MSIRHRVQQALLLERRATNYRHEVISQPGHATFVMEDPVAAQVILEALRLMFKRKPLIHKGGKP